MFVARYQKNKQKRRLTTQFTSVSSVLPRRKHNRVKFPMRPGDDPKQQKLMRDVSQIPHMQRAWWMNEVFVAVWSYLHVITMLVPHFRKLFENRQECLDNVVYFFDNLGDPDHKMLGCVGCRKDVTNRVAQLPGASTRSLVHDVDDPYALAKWLHALHNDVHVRRNAEIDKLPEGYNRIARKPLTWERFKALYELRCFNTQNDDLDVNPTVMEAWLFTEYKIKVRRDFYHKEIVQTTEQKKRINYNYTQRIGNKIKEIYPHGTWNDWWRRPSHASDLTQMFPCDQQTGFVTATLFVVALEAALIVHLATHRRDIVLGKGPEVEWYVAFVLAYLATVPIIIRALVNHQRGLKEEDVYVDIITNLPKPHDVPPHPTK